MKQNACLLLNKNTVIDRYIFLTKTYFCCLDHFLRILHTDLNECNDGIDNCHSFANCSNEIGSFSCSCNDGYTGNGLSCSGIFIDSVIILYVIYKISTAKIVLLELLTRTFSF